MSEEAETNGLETVRLWDAYGALLTARQREITDLYFNYDLSLGEIAEQKGVSRQSVSDCLGKSRRQLEEYEKKLGFVSLFRRLEADSEKRRAAIESWIKRLCETRADLSAELEQLEKILAKEDV